ncbi:hypothetical protein CFP56_020200 [Quercus suber]|uniref:Uncharacterized protein n=1 Tax=Quercus suber TaxID=58331 RepID=A0AAW0KGY1_QUESU
MCFRFAWSSLPEI